MLSKYVLVLLIGRNDAETVRSSSEPEVRWCGEKSPACFCLSGSLSKNPGGKLYNQRWALAD